jgi:hypothetical protein
MGQACSLANPKCMKSLSHVWLVKCLMTPPKFWHCLENFNDFVFHSLLCIWVQILPIFMLTMVLSNIRTQLDDCQWSMWQTNPQLIMLNKNYIWFVNTCKRMLEIDKSQCFMCETCTTHVVWMTTKAKGVQCYQYNQSISKAHLFLLASDHQFDHVITLGKDNYQFASSFAKHPNSNRVWKILAFYSDTLNGNVRPQILMIWRWLMLKTMLSLFHHVMATS